MDYIIKTLSQLRPILVGFRKQAGLTQEAIAQRLGISQQSYAAFEAHPEVASVDRLFRVLRQLGVSITLAASGQPEASNDAAASSDASAIGTSSSPARKRARVVSNAVEAKSSKSEPGSGHPRVPAVATSPTSRKRRGQPVMNDGSPRKPGPARKPREDW